MKTERVQKHIKFEVSRDGLQWVEMSGGVGTVAMRDVAAGIKVEMRQIVQDQEVILTETMQPVGTPTDVGMQYPTNYGVLSFTPKA